MTRYEVNKNIKSRYDGKRFFGTRTYPTINPDDTDIIYITNETDCLDSLAYKFYKDVTLWWIIALMNKLGSGKMSVDGGLQLRIPTRIEQIIAGYNKLNS